MSNILEVNNVSKQYRLGLVSTGTFSHDLNRWWHRVRGKDDPYAKIGEANDRSTKGMSEYVWALKDIDFSIKQGEVLGIIGKNGAGKSTLLKILSRVTGPTTGSIKAYGRIASLLEVGTGFHPELTGRENIFLNGAILGMTKSEISNKFDEIVDFSGCERYIDTPVKRYSSGMYVRLAFAVAAHLEPEILIVDEVLAVGDAEFQKKALGKMKDISAGHGRTVLFVSHNMNAVSLLCDSCLVLSNGMLSYNGDTDSALSFYLKSNKISNRHSYLNNVAPGHPYISSLKLLTSQPNNFHTNGQELGVELELNITDRIKKTCITIVIANEKETSCLDFSYFDDMQLCSRQGKYTLTCVFPKFRLFMGKYSVSFHFAEPPGGRHFESQLNVCSFEVVMYNQSRGDYSWQPFSTVYIEDYDWQVQKVGL